MAALAQRAELAAVDVVAVVTAHAALREHDPLGDGFAVTRFARDGGVSSLELELRPRAVIEFPSLPGGGVMAVAAARAQAASMDVGPLVAGDALLGDILERGRHVAVRTGDAEVRADQRKACKIVIEEDIAPPMAFVMTALAARPFLTAVNVVFAMTGVAARVEALLVEFAAVAVRASDLGVSPAEGETRAPVVLERVTSPIDRRVARLARAAELSAVSVVALMTAVARGRRTSWADPFLVAALARGTRVRAHQREARFAQVVEPGRRPRLRRMARLTGGSYAAVVLVVSLVARVAFPRRGLVSLGRVTALTARVSMPAFQRKRGRIVIETDLLPRGLPMAVVAGRPQDVFMRVFSSMAAAAERGRFAIALARRVAVVTPHLHMSPPQRQIRDAMVERLPVEVHDVGAAA